MRFAIESQLDMIAEKLKLDPIEIRLKNARQSHEQLPNGDNVHNCGLCNYIRKLPIILNSRLNTDWAEEPIRLTADSVEALVWGSVPTSVAH